MRFTLAGLVLSSSFNVGLLWLLIRRSLSLFFFSKKDTCHF